jgi:hypothetical protein
LACAAQKQQAQRMKNDSFEAEEQADPLFSLANFRLVASLDYANTRTKLTQHLSQR